MMAKVLLVEDDNNLREIFEMRLQAEGYDTLSASDGEEALMIATREKPGLIIADVMMPKLSGFEMLETLRAAPEIGNAKVIMMTALGQAEDRARGEKLGVVKYLVKSQVTLEDFVRVVREVLPPGGQAKASTDTTDVQKDQGSKATKKQESEQSMQDDNTNPTPPAGEPADSSANPVSGSDSSSAPAGDQMTSDQQKEVVDQQVDSFAAGSPAGDTGSATPPADPAPMGGDGGGTASPPTDTPSFPPAEPPADEPKPPADGSAIPPSPGV